jgi:hypothetical protein
MFLAALVLKCTFSIPHPMHIHAERAAWPEDSFGDYAYSVCKLCAVRKQDCGCQHGLQNPPLRLLHDYYQKYLHWYRVCLGTFVCMNFWPP